MNKVLKMLLLTAVIALMNHFNINAQQHWNLPLLSNWDDNSIPPAAYGPYNECWGYAANGMEYAFLASSQGTYFFDITNPSSPQLIDFIRTKDTTTLVINKDYVTYSHYLYAVSDQGDNALQIFDLQYLPDSVVLAYESNAISKRCHTVFVENDRLYMCHNTRPDGSLGPMDIFSLADPLNPVLLGTVQHPNFFTVHEVFVRNDTAYCANGYNGLWIYDVSLPATPSLISIVDNYPENGYNHSAWLTDDSQHMVFTDENHGYGVKVFDISDINNPLPVAMIRSNMLQVPDPLSSNGSIAHNPYIIGNILLLSYYHDGVRAYDISDPANPVLVAWHNTFPAAANYSSYAGCWGLYPFLPSGNIIASDMNNGLFILDGQSVLNYEVEPPLLPSVTFGPNPVSNNLELYFSTPIINNLDISCFDVSGKLVFSKQIEVTPGAGIITVPVQALSGGIYFARIQSEQFSLTSKFVKID